MSPKLFAIVTNLSYALAGVAILSSGGEHRVWMIFTVGALVLPSVYAVPAVAAVALGVLVLRDKILFVIGTIALYAEAYALWKMTDPTSYRHGFWHVLTAGGIFTTYYGLVLVG